VQLCVALVFELAQQKGLWQPSSASARDAAVVVAGNVGGLVIAAVGLVLARRRCVSQEHLGLRLPRWGWFLAVLPCEAAVALGLWPYTIFLRHLGGTGVEQRLLTLTGAAPGTPVALFVAFLATITLVAPFTEEWIFRGLVLPALERRAGGTWSVILSSVVFAVAHAADLQVVAPVLLLGLVLGWLRLRSASLWPPLLLHVLNNVLAAAAALAG
jgi:uncharacterized protein